MILDDDGFLDCQEDFTRVHKRAKWLSEHIETLNVLLKYMRSNNAQMNRPPEIDYRFRSYSALQPHYTKYKHMLEKKHGEFFGAHREALEKERIILDSMLYYIDLPDDIKLHMMQFVNPSQSKIL